MGPPFEVSGFWVIFYSTRIHYFIPDDSYFDFIAISSCLKWFLRFNEMAEKSICELILVPVKEKALGSHLIYYLSRAFQIFEKVLLEKPF